MQSKADLGVEYLDRVEGIALADPGEFWEALGADPAAKRLPDPPKPPPGSHFGRFLRFLMFLMFWCVARVFVFVVFVSDFV